jgi:hypothetical protein
MLYVLKLLSCSAFALLVCGLAIAYTPWYSLERTHDIVLIFWLAFVTVALPGLTWFGTAKLLRVL